MESEEERRTTIPIGGKLDDRKNVRLEPRPFEDLPPEVQELLKGKKSKSARARDPLSKLEGKHMLTLILYLDKMSPVLKSDVYNEISRCSNMLDKLNDLRELGIIEIYSTGRTNTNVVVITPKGRQVARAIKGILELVD